MMIANPDTDAPTGRTWTSLWRDREFLKLWGGETVSLFGAQVTALALPLTAVYVLNASSAQVGVLNAAGYAPFLGVALLIGVWVDRCRRRRLMILANVVRAVLIASVPLCAALGVLNIGYLCVVALAVGVLTVLFDVAYQSYLPGLIERDQLLDGNSKLQVSSSLAQISGPGLGGLLIGLFGAPIALLVDAGTYLVSVVSLLAIRGPDAATAVSARRPELLAGLRHIFANVYLRALLLQAGIYNFAFLGLQTVFVLYAARELRLGPGTIGLLLGIGALGSLGGAVAATWFKRRLGLGRAIVAEVALCCCAPLIVPLTSGGGLVAQTLFAVAFVLGGVGETMATVHAVSLRQLLTPDRMLGRVVASGRFLTWGPLPLGALVGGLLGQTIGLRPALLAMACSFLFALLVVLLSPVRALRDFPQQVEETVS